MSTSIYVGTLLAEDWLELLVAKKMWASLHHSTPSLSTPLVTELGGGAYARSPITLGLETQRRAVNTNTLRWGNLPASSVAALVLFDAAVNGNFVIGAPFRLPTATVGSESLLLPPGEVVFQF